MNPNTMPLEAETRVLIDRSLENLGWKLSGKDQNVYYEQPRSEAEKKKLCGKRPDYVLYSKDSDMLKVGFEVIPLDEVRENSYILVGSRYRTNETVASKNDWPLVKVGDLFEIISDTINPVAETGRTVYVGLENIEPSTGSLRGT